MVSFKEDSSLGNFKHSYIKNVAYRYVFAMFNDVINQMKGAKE